MDGWGFLGYIIAAFITGIFLYLSYNHIPIPGISPSPAIPEISPSSALTKDSNISINITYPVPEDNVDHDQLVAGRFTGKLPVGMHAWLMVSGKHGLPFRIWQPEAEIPDTASWEITTQIGAGAGSNESETGNKYELATVLVNDTWHDYFCYYKKTSNDEKYWWNFPLPVPTIDEIEVTRK